MEEFHIRNGEDSMSSFYDKVMKNDRLVQILRCFNCKKWNKLSAEKKISLFKEINKIINTFYPELGESKFGFANASNAELGSTIDDKFIINVEALVELDNHMELLATYLHELRHFYQNSSIELYNKTGVVHELFSQEELLKIRENNQISAMGNVQNYIINVPSLEVEYSIQPTEYDAEMFAMNFMNSLANKFYYDNIDKINCMTANYQFNEVLKVIKKNDNDIFDFKKMYYLNYEDYVKENKSTFETDKIFFDKYIKLVDDIDSLNINNIGILFEDCFWIRCSKEKKLSILEKYIDLLGYREFIKLKYDNNLLYVNDNGIDFNDSFDVLELLLDEMSDIDIANILSKSKDNNLSDFEKAIILNFASDENVVQKEQNPLFYSVQPYVLYKNRFIMEHINHVFESIDTMYGEKYNNFSKLDRFYKKYDSDTKIKKIEKLTGKKFKQIYKEMILNMTKTVRR